jgi:hypothetical protein
LWLIVVKSWNCILKGSVRERSVPVLDTPEGVQRAKKLGLESLNDTMTSRWLGEIHFPEKQLSCAEAFLDMKSTNWLSAHIRAMNTLGFLSIK